jgi:3-O-methylgallate 3,4-dioxygenase
VANLVLGLATSHTPMLTIPADLWASYAENDLRNPELVFPPMGVSVPYAVGLERYVSTAVQDRLGSIETHRDQFDRCQVALGVLAGTYADVKPDVTIVITDDQDEWFFEGNMPAFSIYWGETAQVVPWTVPPGAPEYWRYIAEGYGTVPLDVEVPSELGRFLIEYLMDHDFDVSHMTYTEELYGGRVARRYPTPDGELDVVRETAPRRQGLGHGIGFVITRLMDNVPGAILPVLQNTCYPPNQVRPWRSYDFGAAIARAVAEWDSDVRVAVVASGGLSHFVVDEEFDRMLLDAIVEKNEQTLRTLPRNRLFSATSESLNWVAAAGAMAESDLVAETIDYVPVYRTKAGTGGGWAFMQWR